MKYPSTRPSSSRRPALLVQLGSISLWAFVLLAVPATALASPCGAPGERACCFGERLPSCNEGSIEEAGCSGDCTCGGFNPFNWFSSSGTCRATTPCGGEGQRACCFVVEGFGSCDGDLIEVPGCAGNCLCDGAGTGQSSSGTCVAPTECGGAGQRACCAAELAALGRSKSCDGDLVEVEGCTGDCTCGGIAVNGLKSSGTCSARGAVSEPDTGFTPTTVPNECALRGYADLHVHLFAHLAHGGTTLTGKPYDTAGIDAALAEDSATHGERHGIGTDAVGFGTWDVDTAGVWIAPTGASYGLPKYGAPVFNGWPTWHSTTHQQMYYKWLERAWQGGLRLISALAVTNEALCKSQKHPDSVCEDSMASIDAQLDATWELQRFIDEEVGGANLLCTGSLTDCQDDSDCSSGETCEIGGAQGWFRIVQDPEDARSVIADGKMAVVLGIEVEHLFNCRHDGCRGKEPNETDHQYVARKVQEYYEKGVRHIFPIHNFDNAFGYPATWQDAIHVGNREVTGHWWGAEACPGDGYDFKLDPSGSSFIALFGFGITDQAVEHSGDSSCHSGGLTTLGRFLIRELMERGMVIDIDHMSNKALDSTLTMLEAETPVYPVLASHVQFQELNTSNRHERMRTEEQLTRIRDLGGMIAAMTKDDVVDTDKRGGKYTVPYGTVPDKCRHSSVTFAQAYQYASDVMAGPVAFGSDFNGVAAHVGPRFGHDACGWNEYERSWQERFEERLEYPFTLEGFGTFAKQKTGERTFDFNIDGLAHVGLLPDLVADMETIGVSPEELEPLFQSAEAFIALWERAEQATAPSAPPACAALDVTVEADQDCQGHADVVDPTIDDGSIVATQSPSGPYGLGTTTVRLSVRPQDSCLGGVSCQGSVTVEDVAAPEIRCPPGIVAECTDGAASPEELPVPLLLPDNCGATTLLGCEPSADTAFSLGTTPVSCSATDEAGNTASCNFSVRVQDSLDPDLTVPADIGPVECTSPLGAMVELGSAQASDQCDTSPEVTNDAPEYFAPRQTTGVLWTASDDVGNSASTTQLVTVQDTIPPEISCPPDVVAECTGGGTAEVAVAEPTASDICGSVALSNDSPGTFALGQRNVKHTATDDGGLQSQCDHSVAVVDTTPPEITCPEPAFVECTGNHSAPFTPSQPEVFDMCAQNGGPALSVVIPPPDTFPLGTTGLDYSVTDISNLQAQCSTAVTVQDTTPPTIHSIVASPDQLFAPDHKMVDVELTVVATDICDPVLTPPVCWIASIDSDESDNGIADGNTTDDTRIVGPLSAQLRAERSGILDGRTYTLHVTCSDQAGNASMGTVTVEVPHDQDPS